jgi:hypothetical protein
MSYVKCNQRLRINTDTHKVQLPDVQTGSQNSQTTPEITPH